MKFRNVKVSRREVEEFYKTYKDSLPSLEETINISHILMLVKPSEDAQTAAYNKASEILDKIKNGEDFSELAEKYSDAPDYPEIARQALREMYRQKGADLVYDETGRLQSGLLIRHLVLPGQVENSLACLRFIAQELSTQVHISLMAQYAPTPSVSQHTELGRSLKPEEYETVVAELHRLGLENGWVQELGSAHHFQPDFSQPHPFSQ